MKPPVKKNDVRTLVIENVNAKGFGIGRVDGFVLLVDGALPGDRAEVRVVKVKARYGYAKILRILTPSPHRIESPCPVSGRCGGCQWQHCDYAAQLEFKRQIVIDALVRTGGVTDVGCDTSQPVTKCNRLVLPVLPATPARYRNKAVFPVAPADNPDGFAIGMYAARSHRIVEVSDCLIQHPAHVRVLSVVKEHMRRYKIAPYDETAHKGLLRQIMVRASHATGEIMVVPVINGQKLPAEAALAEALTGEADATTVLISPHTTRSNAVLGESFRVLTGSGYIEETIGDVRYRVSAPSFFQVNTAQAKVLYDIALEMAGLNDPGLDEPPQGIKILDAHTGAGGIALYAAHHAVNKGKTARVIGVDVTAPAITDAIKNAALNGITNAEFITGAAEDVIPALLTNRETPFHPDVVFLDPPRRGCGPPLLDALITAQIPRVVYISCDPATLARDIKILCAGGYGLEAVQPVDMFPMTGHVECVAQLIRV